MKSAMLLGKVAKRAWTLYGIENAEDMRGYMYLYFVVASDFDRDPELGELLEGYKQKAWRFWPSSFQTIQG